MQPKISKAFLMRKHLGLIQQHGGFYITDCWPWSIKTDCQRFDCPMRTLSIPLQAKETDYLLQCDPAGDLADLLIVLRRTQAE